MKRQLLVAEFLSTPWALMPERMNAFSGVIARWSAHVSPSADTLDAISADREARNAKRATSNRATGGGIAVIPLHGVVTQRGNAADDVSGSGGCSTQQFSAALRQAIADPAVGQILIDIDSPGGSVYGVQELAAEIMQARNSKPIIALANSLAASAAYWLGCSAAELYVTPGGEVGSIGVWQAHQDYSAAMAQEGVKTTLVSAGKYKVEGNPYQPLDAPAEAFLQSRVDDYYAAFTQAVAKGRGVAISAVRSGMGQGRVLGATAALAENMVDGIATFDQVIKKMQANAKNVGQSKATGPGAATPRLAAAQRHLTTLS